MSLSRFVQPDAHEWTRGLCTALLSYIAYDTNASRRARRFQNLGFTESAYLNCGNTGGITGLDAFVLTSATNQVLVVFRGTQEFADIVTDARSGKRLREGLLVHAGFGASSRRFMEGFTQLRSITSGISSIALAGHSLGGAVAQIVGYLLQKQSYTIDSVTTFGSPRVGGHVFWKRKMDNAGLSVKYTRWVNGFDVVARQPFIPGPDPRNWSWVHVGRQNYIDSDNAVVNLGDTRRLIPSGRTAKAVDDHSMSGFEGTDQRGYIRNMLSLIPSRQWLDFNLALETSFEDAMNNSPLHEDHEATTPLSLQQSKARFDENLSLAQCIVAHY